MSNEPVTVEEVRVLTAKLESELAEFLKVKLVDFRASRAGQGGAGLYVVGVKIVIAPGNKVHARLMVTI